MEWALEATREWFDRRAQAWVFGQYEVLCAASGRQRSVVEMERRRSMHERRKAADLKTITDIDASLFRAANAKPNEAQVMVDEKVRFLYEISGRIEHEQRVIRHLLQWRKEGRGQSLLRHEQKGERYLPGLEEVGHRVERKDQIDWNTIGRLDSKVRYDRLRALRYAQLWWDRTNPEYEAFAEDCTNYVSQSLYAGGFSMQCTGRRETGWWYRFGPKAVWSFSWSVAHALTAMFQAQQNYFRVKVLVDARELRVGDVIGYDWSGKGHMDHMAVVVGHDPDCYPLVAAHTVNSYRRFYSYEDSHAWKPETRYLYIGFMD